MQNPDAWAILGHQKYLTGDMQEAKNCYERTLSFTNDASEMHSIYLRLASIYLQQAQVSDRDHGPRAGQPSRSHRTHRQNMATSY